MKTKGKPIHMGALQFGVPAQRLRDQVMESVNPYNFYYGGKTLFTHAEELALIEHIKEMSELGYGYSTVQLQYIAGDLAHVLGKRPSNKALSKIWLTGFLYRWSDRITRFLDSDSTSSLKSNHTKSSSRETIDKYHINLKTILEEYELQDKPQFIYNLDETVIQSENTPPELVAPRKNKPQAITLPRLTAYTTTMIACVNGVGKSIPPYFVFKGKHSDPKLMNGASLGAKGVMSDSGWSTSMIVRYYLEDHFLPHVRKDSDKKQPILLICDGHLSHISSHINEWANSNNVILFVLPAHTSHLLQPLDVSVFGPFKKYYYSECAAYMKSNIGQTITRYKVCEMACKAYLKAMTPENIISGFKKTQIYPCSTVAVKKEKNVLRIKSRI